MPSAPDYFSKERWRAAENDQSPNNRFHISRWVYSLEALLPRASVKYDRLRLRVPAMNWPPPRENCTIIGPPNLAAASRHALMPDEETALTAGMAKPVSLAYWSKSISAWPVTTPGLMEAGILMLVATAAALRAWRGGDRLKERRKKTQLHRRATST